MRRFQHICIVVVTLLTVCGCNDCGNKYEDLDFPPYMHQYFEVFVEGNYFVYENQDGTKKDSVYIAEYSEKSMFDNVFCFRSQKRNGNLYSKFLAGGDSVYFSYSIPTGVDGSVYFDFRQGNLGWSIDYSYSEDPPNTFSSPMGDLSIEYFEEFTLIEIPLQEEQEVWKVFDGLNRELYFAKNKGLVQFRVLASEDTFKLINYYIQ